MQSLSRRRDGVDHVGSISRMAVEELGIDRVLVSFTKRAPIVHDVTALALAYMHMVKSEDARRDAAEQLRLQRSSKRSPRLSR